jgi:nucleoside-triphosphatase
MKNEIFILSAPVGTGKTTGLHEWTKQHANAFGILTPVVAGKRIFLDISSGEGFEMETNEDNPDAIKIGRYVFSKKSFRRAEKIIGDAILNKQCEWLIIDEIGPLELSGNGFCNVLKEIILHNDRTFNLILVIRENILKEAAAYFNIDQFKLMTV